MDNIDFGRYSDDYAAYRPRLPASFYQRIDAIIPIRESRSLDLATGPGTIAIELAALGSSVVGIDISAEQIATAKRVSKERELEDKVEFKVGSAENTGLDGSSFDLVTAGQCWHWFDSAAAMAEIQRVLRPDGVLAIAYNSYLAEHSPVAQDTEDLILEFNPSWTMAKSTGMFPKRIDEVIHGGFRLVEQFCYDHDEEFSHARWRGRMRTCSGVGSGGLSPSEVQRFDDALSRLLSKKYPDPMVVEHRVWCVVARKPS
jgi:ubiquinone/menaquinone biosynthesis C-methylase UbiE